MKGRIAILTTIALVLASLLVFLSPGALPADTISGRTERSTGLPSSGTYTTITVADVDEDGYDEMFVGGTGYQSSKTQGIVAYEYNPSTTSWTSFASGLPGSSSGKYYGKMSFGDLDEDGDLDLVAGIHDKWSDSNTNGVEIYTSNGASTFTLAHTIDTGSGTSASVNEVIVEDMDGDDNLDIIVGEYNGVRVFYGSGSSTTWTESSPTANNNEVDGIGVGDLNNDGLLDVVSTVYTGSESDIYIQGASRSWSSPSGWVSSNSQGFGCRIADLDGDGNEDVVYGTRSNGIRVYLGNGGGSVGGTSFTWTAARTNLPTSGGDYMQLEVADMNDDDKPDIICSTRADNKAHVYLNNLSNGWDEIFTGSDALSFNQDAYASAFGDWDNDGNLDIAAGSWGNGVKAWIVSRTITPPPPENNKPMPHAGADIEIMLGEEVLLDGRNSTDPDDAPTGDTDGTVLTYEWNFTSVPASSSINDDLLSPNDTVSRPTFQPDVPGTYEVTLAVFDGEDWSNESDEDSMTITVIKPNDPPVAVTGSDLSGYVGDEFELDGTGSYDIDGEIAAFEWTCTSHTVTLVDPTTSTPDFTPSAEGTYMFTMRVMDDNMTWSLNQDTINVTAVDPGENVLPVADAGTYPSVTRGETVRLDGSNSTDLDGTIISYEWTCTSHTVTFSGQNTSTPSFTASEAVTYTISLRVEDSNHTWSSPDSTSILSEEPYFNDRPVADAGEDREAFVSENIVLDGSGSSDPNGNIAGYNWTCTSHAITLSEPLTATPSFTPSTPGIYVFTLAVRDNEGAWSPEDQMQINVTERPIVPVDIKTGPFLFSDDTPLSGAQVRITPLEGDPLLGVVISDGTSSFTDVSPGGYSLEVLMDGEVKIGPLDINVAEDGNVTYPAGGIPKVQKEDPGTDDDDDQPVDDDDDQPVDDDENDDRDESSPTVIVIAVITILMIAGGAVAFIVIMNRKQDDDEEGEKECPECGSSMEYREDFEKYYCDKCGKYR